MKTKILYEQDNMDYFVANLRDGTINAKGNWEFELSDVEPLSEHFYAAFLFLHASKPYNDFGPSIKTVLAAVEKFQQEFKEIKEWCENNLQGKWYLEARHYESELTSWLFLENDDDLMLTKLRW